jgi:hypothetical protein
MKRLRLLGIPLALGIAATACSPNGTLTPASPPSNQTHGAADRHAVGPNGIAPGHLSTIRGWIISDIKNPLLYLSDESDGIIDIFSVPAYSLVGQITSGIDQPEGIATDKKGNLYVSNLSGDTVTVYKHGQTSPSLTLTESNGPDDVALQKPVTSSLGSSGPAVIEFANMSGSGTNLGLTGLTEPSGVLVDKHGDLVVSDYDASLIDIYPPGDTSPSSTISVPNPDRGAINKKQNDIYVPQGSGYSVVVLSYPGGSPVTSISIGNFTPGTALFPAPRP